MGKVVLIATPEPRRLREVQTRLNQGTFSWAYLGFNVADFRRVKDSFETRGAHIDTTMQFHRAAEDLREPYLSYLYSIGRELNSLRWWISSLAYRNGVVTKVFHNVCQLKLALNLASTWGGPEPLVLVVADARLRRALQQNLSCNEDICVQVLGSIRPVPFGYLRDGINVVAHRALFIARSVYRMFQSRRTVPKAAVPQDVTILFAWATRDNIHQGGEFHKSFFGDLADRLEENGCHVAVAPIILGDVPYQKALSLIQDGPFPLLVPHRYLGILDLIRTVIISFARPPLPRSIPAFSGMDISALVKDDMHRNWVSNGPAEALLINAMVKRWAALDFSISRFIYIFENQPYERALNWEVKRSLPGVTVVGYQHAGVPRLMLNFHLAPEGEEAAPLPDRIVTVGNHTYRILADNGHDHNQLRVGGSLQMQDLHTLRSRIAKGVSPVPVARVLFASSDSAEESAELIYMAMNLFDEGDGVRIFVKCHPRMPYGRVSRPASISQPKHVELTEEPIVDLILRSSLMVYSGSTVAVQALALGLPVIHIRPQFDLDLDPLEAVPDLRLEATGLEELREKVLWLLEHRDEYISQHRGQWNRLVDEFYGPATKDTARSFID